ncbi:MAG TPA: endolytic transglycosylase MltG [Candidatus Saccharimonadales bacterium]|nr:endolytic transglycosylase MltG [Candidatus Saccharimonadales bacterium]
MNDVTPPPRGGLPRPPERPPVRMQGVRSVPKASPPQPEPKEPDPLQPLDLPTAAMPTKVDLPHAGRRWVKWLIITLVVLVLSAIAAGVAGYFWYQDALKAKSDSTESVRFTVDQGETADAVATQLEQKGIIKSALATQIYIKIAGKGDIKAGNYLFSPNQPPAEIFQWLSEGKVDTFKVTVLPGITLTEIKKDLQKYHYSAEAIDEAFAKQYTHPVLEGKPAGTSLEGYLYPETYYVTSDTTVEQLIGAALDEFQKQIEKLSLRPMLAQESFTLYQGITLASIIEKEVTNTSDQRQVAQVFEKRLKEGMVLGSDVTYHYGAKLLGVAASPDVDSPYNTRKVTGLPPGPIANFHIDALKAVAEPAQGDYLFFVAGDDGVTHFARTNAEHEANIRQYCQKLCSTF